MQNDGDVIIGTKLDTSEFEEDLDDLVDVAEDKGEKSGNGFANMFGKASSKIKTKLSRAFSKMAGISKGLLSVIMSIAGTITKLGLGLGVAGVLIGGLFAGATILAGAFKKVFLENEQVKANLQYMVFAVNKALEPAVNVVADILVKIVNLIIKAFQYTAVLIKMITGKNIFADASAEAFAESMKNANKNSKGTAKNLKDAKKQLASFDEMNVLQDASSSGGGGDTGVGITMPDFDVSNITGVEEEVQKLIDLWKQYGNELKYALFGMDQSKWFEAFGKWGLAVRGVTEYVYGLYEVINGGIGIVKGVIDVIAGIVTGDTEKIQKGIIGILDGIWKIIDGLIHMILGRIQILIGLIIGIVGTLLGWLKDGAILLYDNVITPIGNAVGDVISSIIGFVDDATDFITKCATNIGNAIGDGIFFIRDELKKLKQKIQDGIIDLVGKAKNKFDGMVAYFKEAKDRIVNLFRTIGTSVGNAVGGAFKNVINGVLGAIENILNSPIKAINSLINTIRVIPGLGNLKTLKTFKLPRLAKGGIINMPGRGVPIGGAIAGERGQEGVIPLTDSQQMELLGQAIGKYINVNATIPVYVGNRQIARELKKINAEDDFAFNR